jgi:DNA-directed RNA polymerase specialized sigma subunit
MTSVLTGDIINSQKTDPKIWIKILKENLNFIGDNPKVWEIYRGDSFQVEVNDPKFALEYAIRLKAAIKQIKFLDVRIAIGIGQKSYSADKVTESNGTAFVLSGEKFEQILKDKQTLAISTIDSKFNIEMNLLLKLALIAMNNWTANSAEIVLLRLKFPEYSQKRIGEILGIKQNAVSYRLKRSYFTEIQELLELYNFKLNELKI